MKEGLDNFFSKTASSPGGQGSSATPIGSPMVEDIKNLSTSSTPSPSLVSRSREDLRMKVSHSCPLPKYSPCSDISNFALFNDFCFNKVITFYAHTQMPLLRNYFLKRTLCIFCPNFAGEHEWQGVAPAGGGQEVTSHRGSGAWPSQVRGRQLLPPGQCGDQ